jgi:hypothetical protein
LHVNVSLVKFQTFFPPPLAGEGRVGATWRQGGLTTRSDHVTA